MGQFQLINVEYFILVRIHHQSRINAFEHLIPLIEGQETIAKNNVLSHAVLPDNLDGFGVPLYYGLNRNLQHFRLVDETVEGHDILVPILCKELRELIVDVK